MSQEGQFSSKSPQRKWAFALVHGIGTTKPMELIEEITDALGGFDKLDRQDGETAGIDLKGPIEAYRLDEENRHQYALKGRFAGDDARFAAVEWSDISFYKDGLSNLLTGLMLTSFGVRYFADAATRDDSRIGSVLGFLLRLIVRSIVLFVFPFTLASLMFGLMGLLAENVIRGPYVSYQALFIVVSSVLAGLFLYWASYKRAHDLQSERTLAVPLLNALLVYTLLLGVLLLSTHLGQTFGLTCQRGRLPAEMMPCRDGAITAGIAQLMQWSGRLIDHQVWVAHVNALDAIGVFYGMLHWVQTIGELFLLILALLAVALAIVDFAVARLSRGTGHSLVFATVSVISIWIMNMVVLWPENVITAAAMIAYSRQVDPLKAKEDDPTGHGCQVVDASGRPDKETWENPHCPKVIIATLNPVDVSARLAYVDDVATVVSTQREKSSVEDGSGRRRQEWRKAFHGYVPVNLNEYYSMTWLEVALFVFFGVVMIAAICIVIARTLWCWWAARCWGPGAGPDSIAQFAVGAQAQTPARSNWPRLIVSTLYINIVLGLMVVAALYLLAQGPQVLPAVITKVDETMIYRLLWGINRVMAYFTTVITPNAQAFEGQQVQQEVSVPFQIVKIWAIVSVLAFAFTAHYIREITKLVLDVVNHFAMDKHGEPATRRRIADRFAKTIEFLLKPQDRPHLVVLAHSQGTVITFDALRGDLKDGKWVNGLWDQVKDRVASLTVVTFGSPVSHIYQRYFALAYPPLKETGSIAALKDEPRFRWFNVYRVDDYVGTYVENSVEGVPVNVPMPPGGHIRYWEADVFKRLRRHPQMSGRLDTLIGPAAAAE